MNTQRVFRLTPAGQARIDDARRRLGLTAEEIAFDRETPSANTVRKALRGEPVFVRTLERISDFLERRCAKSRIPFTALRDGEDYAADASGLPRTGTLRGWISRRVPAPNRLFTGRADTMARLHRALRAAAPLADPQALTGLGGMGKTQTAIAYIYRHRTDYERIFWANADTEDALEESLAAIADELELARGSRRADAAERARDWFRTAADWLLVCDNADDLERVGPRFPPRQGGRILITTRAAAPVRWAAGHPLDPFAADDGATLLLRRAGRIAIDQSVADAPAEDADAARRLCADLGGLPLAIGQAGAWLADSPESLDTLRRRLQVQGIDALERAVDPEHASVAATYQIALDHLARSGADGLAAADLLRTCAFLDGDSIPDSVLARFGEGARIRVCALSLAIRLDGGLQFHRLVQAAVRHAIPDTQRRSWEVRALEAVASATPDFERPDWQTVAALLPQWRACAVVIRERDLNTPDAVHVLYQAGRFCRIRAVFDEAERFQREAAARAEVVHPGGVVQSDVLDELACLLRDTDRLDDAAERHRQAVAIACDALGPDDPVVAARLHNQALCETERGEYARAADGFRRAIAIRRCDPDGDLYAAAAMTQLGAALRLSGDLDGAETAYRDALALFLERLDPEHAEVGIASNNLAVLLVQVGRADEADPLFTTALRISERTRGSHHPDTGAALWGLARVRRAQGRIDEARALFARAAQIYDALFDPGHRLIRRFREDRGDL